MLLMLKILVLVFGFIALARYLTKKSRGTEKNKMTETELEDLMELLLKFKDTYSDEFDNDALDSIEHTLELVEVFVENEPETEEDFS